MVDTPTLTEFGLPALVTVGDDVSTTALMRQRAAEHPGRLYCEYKSASGSWVPVTLSQFADQVTAVAKGLAALGVARGDSVGLLASTRFEWAVFDFAIMASGGVTVPIYPSSSASQVEWIAGDAALTLLIVETPKMAAAMNNLPGTPRVLAIDGGAPAVDTLVSAGEGMSDSDLEARTSGATPDDIASIVYTSGTTGSPKGVELTHRNLVEHALNAAAYPDLHKLTAPGKRIRCSCPWPTCWPATSRFCPWRRA